jgi:hypothetical protein
METQIIKKRRNRKNCKFFKQEKYGVCKLHDKEYIIVQWCLGVCNFYIEKPEKILK